MRGIAAAALVLASFVSPLTAQAPEQVINVQASAAAMGTSFESLFAAYKKADQAGDSDGALAVFQDLRWYRIERNITSLEGSSLALCALGVDRLMKGERDRARDEFARAVLLDPHLSAPYFGLAMTALRQGPVGLPAALHNVVQAVRAPFLSVRGRHRTMALVTVMGFLGLMITALIYSLAMLARYGTLLHHDLEEAFGGGSPVALGLFVLLLGLPVVTLQGYGWLPLWWLVLLFPYVGLLERGLSVALLATSLALPPLVATYDEVATAGRNPLFRAAILAMEAGPDTRAVIDIEAATAQNRDDRDLSYLLAALYKKVARYDDAINVYREILRADPKDPIALNNLANIEFARGDYLAAIARYKQAASLGAPSGFAATFYYNLSLAHLQRFEYDASVDARRQADRVDPILTRRYEVLWKGDRRGSAVSAVVDLGLTNDQVWAKFAGVREGPGIKNVVSSPPRSFDATLLVSAIASRFVAFALAAAAAVLLLNRWRGRNTFTMLCQKCGTSFCKRCHLGAVVTGLCTQCHHLFVVRDGVSGPARNRKLLEVQKEEERRNRAFRLLSWLVPGAGHVYAHRPIIGLFLIAAWSIVVCLLIVAGRMLPFTETPSRLVGFWGFAPHVLVLVALYVVANRSRPDFGFFVPAPARGASPRRPSGRFAQ